MQFSVEIVIIDTTLLMFFEDPVQCPANWQTLMLVRGDNQISLTRLSAVRLTCQPWIEHINSWSRIRWAESPCEQLFLRSAIRCNSEIAIRERSEVPQQ